MKCLYIYTQEFFYCSHCNKSVINKSNAYRSKLSDIITFITRVGDGYN